MKAYFSGRAEALFDVSERHSLADRDLSELTAVRLRDHSLHLSRSPQPLKMTPPSLEIAVPAEDVVGPPRPLCRR